MQKEQAREGSLLSSKASYQRPDTQILRIIYEMNRLSRKHPVSRPSGKRQNLLNTLGPLIKRQSSAAAPKTSRVSAELRAAYKATTYRIERSNSEVIGLKIGIRCPVADALLRTYGADQACFLTAYNPRSEVHSEQQNQRAQNRLESLLQRAGYQFIRGAGEGSDPRWKPERSVFIIGMSRYLGFRLARAFAQHAFVHHKSSDKTALVFC